MGLFWLPGYRGGFPSVVFTRDAITWTKWWAVFANQCFYWLAVNLFWLVEVKHSAINEKEKNLSQSNLCDKQSFGFNFRQWGVEFSFSGWTRRNIYPQAFWNLPEFELQLGFYGLQISNASCLCCPLCYRCVHTEVYSLSFRVPNSDYLIFFSSSGIFYHFWSIWPTSCTLCVVKVGCYSQGASLWVTEASLWVIHC